MVDPKLPSNLTSMLMQAQERKNLVNKLINLKATVDQNEPKSFSHLSSGRVNRRNSEVRKINAENQQMLNKIMSIMNRKPKENGLNGVPLRRQASAASIENKDHLASVDGETGNADIKLVHKNVEAVMMAGPENNRFSFDINPNQQMNTSRGINPFKQDDLNARGSAQYSNNTMDTQPLNTPFTDEAAIVAAAGANVISTPFGAQDSVTMNNLDANGGSKTNISGGPDKGTQPSQSSQKVIGEMGGEANYQSEDAIVSSQMFDKNVPISESEQKFQFHPINTTGELPYDQNKALIDVDQNQLKVPSIDADALTFLGPSALQSQRKSGSTAPKKLYPGQVTLNHVVRKNEVRRINRENMVMLKALREVKPTIQRTNVIQKQFIKQEQYKRNVSKFRPVNKSVPKPRPGGLGAASEGLPDINRQYGGTNTNSQSEIQFPNPNERHSNLGLSKRRTSQGNRSYFGDQKRQFSVPPGSQRSYQRNTNQNNFNSGTIPSDYPRNISTRQTSAVDQEVSFSVNPTTVQGAATTYTVFPAAIVPEGGVNSVQQRPYASNTVDSSRGAETSQNQSMLGPQSQSDNRSAQTRRPSYLQKLKQSPLLTNMTQHQNIPKSIVNRVIGQREQADRTAFRKYGLLPPRSTVVGVADHLYRKPVPIVVEQSAAADYESNNRVNGSQAVGTEHNKYGSQGDTFSTKELGDSIDVTISAEKPSVTVRDDNLVAVASLTEAESSAEQTAKVSGRQTINDEPLVLQVHKTEPCDDGASLQDKQPVPAEMILAQSATPKEGTSQPTGQDGVIQIIDQVQKAPTVPQSEVKDGEFTQISYDISADNNDKLNKTPDNLTYSDEIVSEVKTGQDRSVDKQPKSPNIAAQIDDESIINSVEDKSAAKQIETPEIKGQTGKAASQSSILNANQPAEYSLKDESVKEEESILYKSHSKDASLDKSGRNKAEKSIKSMPISRDSKQEIATDEAKDKEEAKVKSEEETYSMPEESYENGTVDEADYSNEDFEDETLSPKRQTQKIAPKQIAIENQDKEDSQDEYEMDYASDEHSPDRLPRQETYEIAEESGLETQHTGAFRQTTSGIPDLTVMADPSRVQDDVDESTDKQMRQGPGSLVSLPEAANELEEDVASEAKTISQSRSQAANQHRIQYRGSNMTGRDSGSGKAGDITKKSHPKGLGQKRPTQNALEIAKLTKDSTGERVLQTAETGKDTLKSVKEDEEERKMHIIQDKENIILSQPSSKNMLEKRSE